MNQRDQADQFYQLHHTGTVFVIPNPWDAGSARTMAAKGFKALATSSVAVDHSNGKPGATAGMDDIIANARIIAEATDLPVSVDLEDCYGADEASIAATIRRAADAGAVGGSIEDAVYARNGEIYSLEHAVARVRAAVSAAAALPFKFTLTARAENFLWGKPDMDDTIVRLKAYADAGADAVYAPGLTDKGSIRAVVEAAGKPVNVLLGLGRTGLTVADMQEIGVARVSLGSALHRAAMTTMIEALDEIRTEGSFGFTAGSKSMGEMDALLATGAAKRPAGKSGQ